MSDGNFNRALLPSTPYRSGIKMGKQQATAKAFAALQIAMETLQPPLTEQQREMLKKNFERELRFHP